MLVSGVRYGRQIMIRFCKTLQVSNSLHFNVIGTFVLKSDTWSPDVIDAGKDFVQGL